MAAAASSLLSVASAAGAGDGVQVQLEPQLCLLLYRSQAHASDEMQRALDWMKARYPVSQLMVTSAVCKLWWPLPGLTLPVTCNEGDLMPCCLAGCARHVGRL